MLNPYAPPMAEPEPPPPAAADVRRMASRGNRFFGSVIDMFFNVPIAFGLFAADRRCVHDRMAGTYVVDVR